VALRGELSSRGRGNRHYYLFAHLGRAPLHQRQRHVDAIAARHNGVGGFQNQAMGLIDSLERVIRELRLTPLVEDAGV
jgi:hypothetical protein